MVAAVALIRDMDPWRVTRVPGSLLLGPDAVQPSASVPAEVAIGLAMHLFLAVLVGAIYAARLPRLGVSPVAGGLLTGAILYFLGFWVLPLLFPVWLASFWIGPVGKMLQAAAHVAYGLVFGWSYRHLTRGYPLPAGR